MLPAQSLEAASKADPTVFGHQAEVVNCTPNASQATSQIQNLARQVPYFTIEQPDPNNVVYSGQSVSWNMQSQIQGNQGR